MTRDTLVGNARNSTMSAVKELGSIQQSLNNSTQSSPKLITTIILMVIQICQIQ